MMYVVRIDFDNSSTPLFLHWWQLQCWKKKKSRLSDTGLLKKVDGLPENTGEMGAFKGL